MDGERSCLTVNFGFQLEIEAISADVNLPTGLDGVGAVCSADLGGDGVGVSGIGSPCQVQASLEGACVAGSYEKSPCVSVTRCPEIEESDFFGSLDALSGRSGDLGRVFLFLLVMVRQREGQRGRKSLSARGDGSGKRKRRDDGHQLYPVQSRHAGHVYVYAYYRPPAQTVPF